MTPYEFGYLVGGAEKNASAFTSLMKGLGQAAGTGRKALTGINNASKSLVQGAGGVISGTGGLVKAVGETARGAGSAAVRGSRGAVRPAPGRVGMLGDLKGILGHSAHLGGRATNTTGRGLSWLGDRVDDLGKGVAAISDAPMGIPTLAAGGLLTAGANVAPKIPLPNIRFQSPIDVDVSYKTQRPVEFNW